MSPEGNSPVDTTDDKTVAAPVAIPTPTIGTWEWDARTGKIIWSREIYLIFGLDPQAFDPNIAALSELTVEEDRWVHEIDATEAPPEPFSIYYRIRRPDGTLRTLRETGGASPSWTPETPRVIGALMDVTEPANAELSHLAHTGHATPATIGSWHWDSANGHMRASPETLEILGLNRDGVICEEERLQLIHPEDRARVQHAYQRAAKSGTPFHLRYRILRPNGEVRVIEEDGLPGTSGVFEGRVADITERTRLERNLVRAQSLGKIGSWEYNPKTGVLWWSDQTYRLLGFEPRSVVPSTQLWFTCLHPEDLRRARRVVEQAALHQTEFTVQYRVRWPNGETRALIEQGEIVDGMELGLLTDITDRHRSEHNLAEAQRIAGLGSWSVDAKKEIHWSEQIYRLIGVPPYSVPASVALWAAHIHVEDRERVLAAYAEAERTLAPYSMQYRVIRTDNQTRHILEQCEVRDGCYSGYALDITERQKAQRHLAKAQEIAKIGSWEWDPITDQTWVSDELYQMLGLSKNWRYSRERWFQLVHPNDRERLRQVYEEADARHGGFSLQYQLRQPDGSYRLYYEQSEPNDAGTFTGILWDITDLTRAQRNMTEAQRIARIGSWEWEIEGDRHWWSEECYRILGLDPETVPASGDAWRAILHPDDFAWTELEFAEAANNGRPYSYQYRIVRPDGQVRTVFESAEVVSAGRYAGTVMDVTERVKIETKLAESQRMAKLGTWEWNMATDERVWSEECYRLYGVSPSVKPVTRAIWQATVHPDDLSALQALIAGVEASPRPYSYRCRVCRPDGTIRITQVHGEPVADFGPNNPIITGTTLDITERESIESQLQHAQKMEAVGQLTGGIAHDFNNLLGAVLGNIDLLMEEIDDRPRAKTLAERAVAAAESGAQLVRRLLAFSRKQTLNAQVTDVNELIVNMLDLLRRSLGDKAQINTSLAAGPIYCVIDRAQTEGALLNLCINARDAMPDGGSATVSTRLVVLDERRHASLHELRPGAYAELTVADSGIGMPRHVAERAFEPFFTTKAPGKGSGLGLSMVYGFVKQSEGHIEIDSEPGDGTAVRIYLPIHADATRAAVDLVRPVPTNSRGRELVLVVEDNADLRGYAVNAVRSFGYRALSAPCAKTALRLIENRPDIALLFTDIVFKEGPTGIQLADLARRRRPDLPVLLTSGYLGDSAQARIGQANTFTLAKPFRAADVGRKLAEIFGADPSSPIPTATRTLH